jgi:hypothetical protein
MKGHANAVASLAAYRDSTGVARLVSAAVGDGERILVWAPEEGELLYVLLEERSVYSLCVYLTPARRYHLAAGKGPWP